MNLLNVAGQLIYKIKKYAFEINIKQTTKDTHDFYISYAKNIMKLSHEVSDNQIIDLGTQLREKTCSIYRDKYKKLDLKIMIDIPNRQLSPGGYSLFMNLANAIRYLGVSVKTYSSDEVSLNNILSEYNPDIFLSSDDEEYKKNIDWQSLQNFKKKSGLLIGLTASLSEYKNTPLNDRLDWAKNNSIDFYYSFRDSEYLQERPGYNNYYDRGYSILSIPFGANIEEYYPVTGIKEIDYIFLGSHNYSEYSKYFSKIFKKYSGFIGGAGWINFKWVDINIQRYLYAISKIGLNIHGPDHRQWSGYVTERTYILAACGIPQVVDNAKLLTKLFPSDSLFIASSPRDYFEQFEFAINNYDEAKKRAKKAMEIVYGNYTSFHRASSFIEQIMLLMNKKAILSQQPSAK